MIGARCKFIVSTLDFGQRKLQSIDGRTVENPKSIEDTVSSAHYQDFYSLVIKFDNHKEILYQELMSPGASYVYTPDPSTNHGRLMVLSEEPEVV